MTVNPKVSIIIPVHDGETYIAESIDSALGQTLESVEVVVVDDGSTDGTAAILERYEGRILVVSQENHGPSTARNRGFEASQGVYVSFLDSDDLLLPEKSALQAEILDDCPDVGLCFGACEAIDARDGRVIKTTRSAPGAQDRSEAPFPPSFPTLAFTVRREWLERVGGYDEDLRVSEDSDLRFKLWAAGCRFQSHTDLVGRYRIYMGSLSTDPARQWHVHLRVAERHIAAMGDRISPKDADMHRAFTWLRIACGHIATGSDPEAGEALARALALNPQLLTRYSNWDLILNHADPAFPGKDESWSPGLSEIWESILTILDLSEAEPGVTLAYRGRTSEKAVLAHAMYRRAFADGRGFRARKLFIQYLLISRGRLPIDEPTRHALQVVMGPVLTKLTVKLQRLFKGPRK